MTIIPKVQVHRHSMHLLLFLVYRLSMILATCKVGTMYDTTYISMSAALHKDLCSFSYDFLLL